MKFALINFFLLFVGLAETAAQSTDTIRVMVYNLLTMARLIGDACDSFNRNCAVGIEPNHPAIKDNLENSLMLVTALNTHIGYYNAAKIAKKAHKEGTTLRQAALDLELLTNEQFDEWVDPTKMLGSME